MANGRQSAQWDRTCSVIATMINANRRNTPPIRPSQLHPMRKRHCGNSGGLGFDPETVRAIGAALKAREEAAQCLKSTTA